MATLTRLVRATHGHTPRWYQAGDSSTYPGHVVEDDDSDEVKICTASGIPFGVAGLKRGHDINSAYTAGEMIPVWTLRSGVEIYVLHDDDTGATTLNKGSFFVTDDANAGCVMIDDADPAFEHVVGMLLETVTISGDTATFILLKI